MGGFKDRLLSICMGNIPIEALVMEFLRGFNCNNRGFFGSLYTFTASSRDGALMMERRTARTYNPAVLCLRIIEGHENARVPQIY